MPPGPPLSLHDPLDAWERPVAAPCPKPSPGPWAASSKSLHPRTHPCGGGHWDSVLFRLTGMTRGTGHTASPVHRYLGWPARRHSQCLRTRSSVSPAHVPTAEGLGPTVMRDFVCEEATLAAMRGRGRRARTAPWTPGCSRSAPGQVLSRDPIGPPATGPQASGKAVGTERSSSHARRSRRKIHHKIIKRNEINDILSS